MAQRIEHAAGAVSITALRHEFGMSKNRLASSFGDQIGLSPKSYARVLRFNRALHLLRERGRSLSITALEAGYYDQAHMTTEFRALGHNTPRGFVDAVRYPASVHLAEQ